MNFCQETTAHQGKRTEASVRQLTSNKIENERSFSRVLPVPLQPVYNTTHTPLELYEVEHPCLLTRKTRAASHVCSLSGFSFTFNILNSQNGSLTNHWQRQSDDRIKACHRPTRRDTGSATRFEFDHSVCLPATDWQKTLFLTAAPVFSAHVLHLSPLFHYVASFFLFYAAFFSLSHSLSLSPSVFPSAAFLCLPPALYSSPFFSALIDPAAECSAATDVFGWGCWWLNGLRDLPNDCLEQQPQGHKTEWN